MLHHFLFAPFANAARQQLYEEVQAILRADPAGLPTLLLGSFAVEAGGEPLDAVVIRPHSITLLVFVPGGGRLGIPALSYGAWKLDARPIPGVAGADNPFEQFRRQKAELAAWLGPQLTPEQANLQFVTGLVVFGAPVQFGPEVEEQLSQQPGSSFQLLAEAAGLPRRLRQLATPEIDLSADDLAQWARDLTDEPTPAPVSPAAEAPAPGASLWGRVWRWLGAEDVPHDAPYGSYPAERWLSAAPKSNASSACSRSRRLS
ncbi:hypothetical protein [Hymenobacter sp. B81]|uniref:hypothetical protein n=1 Tax=Hymenobacter sp. B81 TaxID=3344878 RepID=UPI0037DC8623